MKLKKQAAKRLFCDTQMSRKEIAKHPTVRVTEKTLRKWIEEGNWQDIKDTQAITRPQLLKEAYSQLAAINNEVRTNYNNIPSKALSDAKGVIIKELTALSDQPLHQTITVVTELMHWVSITYPAKTEVILDIVNEWVEHQAADNKLT